MVKWIKPKPPYVKLNTDGSLGPNGAGAGGIIRNNNGIVLATFATPIYCRSAIQAEINALILGLQVCSNLGFNFIWIEVDAALLIQIISNAIPGNPENYYRIRKLKLSLTKFHYHISHIFREANSCADWLAKYGCDSTSYEDLNINNLHPLLLGMILLDNSGLPYIRYG
ncbi:hypothetical protein KFK09_019378 [Dendrobium nobile]|uniref:RNase H type-1 domain-containing protein n=1 Tax=Dendrobium nobile TaxID=94219 RepID=A0A8T3AQT3_DENNO|nr:hypothetical protein KFK09_019378 [Dendrobium nobile]